MAARVTDQRRSVEDSTRLGSLRTAEGGKSGVNGYANGLADVVAHRLIDLLSDPVSPVVASRSVSCRIFLRDLATAPKKGRFKVARYPLPGMTPARSVHQRPR